MRKILMCIFSVLFCADGLAAPQKMYIDTEQKYIFTSENLQQTIPDFVENENKQLEMVRLYQELMNQETGAVSVANLLAVCRAGGFNTYRQTGYEQCRAFVEKLLENAEQEAEEGFMGGFCPAAYDENGKQQNGLRSINENTRIGDFCSSTNIAGGEVVFRKGYNCTCAAYACNPGFQSKGGACVTIIADGNGNCLRKEYTNVGNLSEPGATLKFCESKSVQGCKVINGIKNFGGVKGKVVCNATQEEVTGVKARNTACPMQAYPETTENNTTAKCQSFCRAKAQQNSCKYTNVIMQHSKNQCVCNPNERSYSASNIYKEVCGDDKGKTGKKEYCVTDFFNWTQTQIGQAIGFAQDYARIMHGNTVYCSNNYRKAGNDDWVKCATKEGSVFYEFKFDDVRESVDMDRRLTERSALCRLVGGKPNSVADNKVCRKIDVNTCNKNLKSLAQKYGHTVQWADDKCNFTADGDRNVIGTDEFEKSLAKIDGLDNRAFFNLQVIAVRGNFVLEDEIEKYVKGKIPATKKVTCDPGYKSIKVADGILARIVGNHDDIKRCYVDGKPIDFVFDDLSEITKLQRDAGEQGAKCITSDGKFDGHYCRGLTKSECFELEEKLLTELKTRGWAGDGDLVDWDDRAGACELNAAQFARNINKTGEYVAIAGLTVAGVFTGGSTTVAAIGLMATELAGMAGEIYVERKKELLPQQWADEFLKASRACKSASCAETTLRSNFGKIQQVQDMLNKDVLNDVDTELARLAELLPDSRFEEIMNSAQAPNCWETWECQEKIFMGMQMASLGVAIGKGLIKLTKVISRKAGAAAAKKTTAFARLSSNVDDVTDGAKGATKGKGPSGDNPGAPHGTGSTDDAARNGSRADGGNGTGGSGTGTSSGSRATGETGGIYDATYFSNNPSAVDDVFKNANDVVQIKRQNMKAATLRDLMRKAEAHGFECSDCGGDILKFTKKADNVTDDVTDGAKGATKGKGASGDNPGAPHGTGSTDDAARNGSRADGGNGTKNTGKATDGASISSFSPQARTIITEINEIGKNRDYVIIKGVGRRNTEIPFSKIESEYVEQLVKDRDDLIIQSVTQENGSGGTLGANRIIIKKTSDMFSVETPNGTAWYRRIKTKPINNLRGKAITTINGKSVFLEPLDNGGFIGNASGRPVVVVNYDGHKIPFYTSTGMAGKLDVPTGKWEVFFGFGNGWLNKGSINEIVGHYGSPELKKIAEALDNAIGDQRNLEDVFYTTSRKEYKGIGNVAIYEGPEVSKDFINSLLDFTPVKYGDNSQLFRNIEYVKGYFKGGVNDAVRQGSINISKADNDLIQSAISKKQAGTLTNEEWIHAIRTMDKYFDKNAATQFAQQMRQDVVDIFLSHADEAMDAITDGKKYAEFLVKYLGPKYGVNGLRVQVADLGWRGYAQYYEKVLYLNLDKRIEEMTGQTITHEQMINLVTHEFAHAIDDLAPQHGVIGKTLNKYGDVNALYCEPGKLKDGKQDMYELIPTERSAHLVGDIVSGSTKYGTKVTNSVIDEIRRRL